MGGVSASVSPASSLNGRSAFALRVLRPASVIAILSALRRGAGDDAGVGVEREPGRQPVGRELHRPLAGAGDAVQERMAGPGPVDLRAVDARRGQGPATGSPARLSPPPPRQRSPSGWRPGMPAAMPMQSRASVMILPSVSRYGIEFVLTWCFRGDQGDIRVRHSDYYDHASQAIRTVHARVSL